MRVAAVVVCVLLSTVAVTQEPQGTISIAWTPVGHPLLSGYRVMYGEGSVGFDSPFDDVPQELTAWMMTSLIDCVEYHFAVLSLGVEGSVSDWPKDDDGNNDILTGWARPRIDTVIYDAVGLVQVNGANFRSGVVITVDGSPANVVRVSCYAITIDAMPGATLVVVNEDGTYAEFVIPIKAPDGQTRTDLYVPAGVVAQ